MKQKPLEVTLKLPIQTYDIDFAGVVSNIVYIRWLEDLRLKMLESYLPLEKLIKEGYCPTLNSTQIKYQQALRLFDRPLGKMWMSELGRLRCTLQAEIYLGNRVVTTASQTGFFLDLETMRPLPIPKELKEIYTQND